MYKLLCRCWVLKMLCCFLFTHFLLHILIICSISWLCCHEISIPNLLIQGWSYTHAFMYTHAYTHTYVHKPTHTHTHTHTCALVCAVSVWLSKPENHSKSSKYVAVWGTTVEKLLISSVLNVLIHRMHCSR